MSIPKYFVDANLTYKVKCWKGQHFVHGLDIDSKMSDQRIWEYALENNLTIITKDADFYDRIIISSPPPKVIHLRIGNLRLRDFISFIEAVWGDVSMLSESNKLVLVYFDRIEAIE